MRNKYDDLETLSCEVSLELHVSVMSFWEVFFFTKLKSKKNGKVFERKPKPMLDGSLVADSQVNFCKNCTLKVIS